MSAVFDYQKSCLSPAKINLFLDIEDRLDNGYHLLSTVMQTIAPTDQVSIRLRRRQSSATAAGEGGQWLSFTYSSNFWESSELLGCAPEDNLMTKAVKAFWHDFLEGFLPGMDRPFWEVELDLKKTIPDEAGLGGGSSNAAAVLSILYDYLKADSALRRQFAIPLPLPRDLAQTAGRLGADIPFFLTGGLAYCTGIGDLVEPLAPLPAYPILLVQPDFFISTALAYERWDHLFYSSGPKSQATVNPPFLNRAVALEAIKRGDLGALQQAGGNIFEKLSTRLTKLVLSVSESAYDSGALLVQLSGSGSAVYCIFPTVEKRNSFAENIGNPARFAGRTCRIFKGEFLNDGLLMAP